VRKLEALLDARPEVSLLIAFLITPPPTHSISYISKKKNDYQRFISKYTYLQGSSNPLERIF